MADERGRWWPEKLKLLEANYERYKLKIRQDSLYCKLFIIQLQNAFDEERYITQKYEKKAITEQLRHVKQEVVDLANEKELIARKAVEDLSNVESEWKSKTDLLVNKIDILQEQKENEIKSKDVLILEITKELEDLKGDKHHQTHSKEALGVENDNEQLANKRKMDQSKEARVLLAENCPSTSPSSSIETQTSYGIVPRKAKTVSGKGNCSNDMGQSNLVDNSEKVESLCGEKVLESELGSVLEITEEMLKSCRRRSTLKRKKSEFCDPPHESNESDTVELSECTKREKKRKERRVTFSGELEMKLPDGSKEVMEIDLEDISGQVETHDATEEDLRVFDDILSRETHVPGEGLDFENKLGLKDVIDGGTDAEETATVKTKGENELSGKTGKYNEVFERIEEIQRPSLDENQTKESKRTALKKKTKKKKGRKVVSAGQESEQNNMGNKDDVENSGSKGNDKMKDNKNRRFSVEADILLSADRQPQELNFGCNNISQEKSKISENEVQVKSYQRSSDELPNSQLPGTGGRGSNNQPKRGLRRHANIVKPTKRLLNVFGDEPKSKEVIEETQDDQRVRERKIPRNTRGNKKKYSKSVAKKKMVNHPSSENSKEDFEPEDRVEFLEKYEAIFFVRERDVKSEFKEAQKPKNTKALRKKKKSSKFVVVERQDEEGKESKRRGKRKRGKTTSKEAKKSLLLIRNEAEDGGNNTIDVKNDREAQNCSPKQLSSLANKVESSGRRKREDTPDEVEDDIEQSIDNKSTGEGKDELFIKNKNGKRKGKNASKKVNKAVESENDIDNKNTGEGKDELFIKNKNGKRKGKKASKKVNRAVESENDKANEGKDELRNGGKRKRGKNMIELDGGKDEVRQEVDENKGAEKDGSEENNIQGSSIIETEIISEVTIGKGDDEIDNEEVVKDAQNATDENRRKYVDLKNHPTKAMETNTTAVDCGENNSDQNKPRRAGLKSKKRKSPEPDDHHEENTDGGFQELNGNKENTNAYVEFDHEHGSDEKVEGMGEKQETIRNSDEIKQREFNLRSKKRKSVDPEIEQHDEEMKDLNESKEKSRVDVELKDEEGLCENIKEGMNNRRPRGKNTKAAKEKSDFPVVNSAKKVKSKKENDVVYDKQASNGVTLNLQSEEGNEEEKQSGKVAEKVDDKDKNEGRKTNKRGRKRDLDKTRENDMNRINKDDNEEEERQSGKVVERVDDDDKSEARKTNKRGRKRDLDKTRENDMNRINKDDNVEEERESGKVVERVDDDDKNEARKTNKRGRKRVVAETKENDMNEINKDDDEVSGRGKSTKKTNEEEVTDKKEPQTSGEISKPEKPLRKKRRTLYSNSSTFINTTSSVFQETLSLNHTRNSNGMPPTLSAFMKAFIVPKLKKK